MKIYFDGILYTWQKGGGIYRYFEEIMASVSKENISVTLVMHSPSLKINLKDKVNFKNIFYIKHVPDSLFKYIRKIMSPINTILIQNYFKNIEEGIFHSTYYTTYKNLKIPQVVTLHDMTYEKFPIFFNSLGAKRFIKNKRKCLENANSIICISNATKKALLDMYKIDESKISIIYHGISEEFLKDSPAREITPTKIRPYFLFVGNRILYKNFAFFITSFSKWNKNKDYDIILTGKELEKGEIKIIETLNLTHQIKSLGFVSEENLRKLYSNSEAFIFPSLDEGFGLPILEAISSHANVLASNIEVFREIGEDMITYFDPTNEGSLIEALEKNYITKTTEEQFEKRAEYVRNKFTWDKCTKETIEIYKKLKNNI